MTREELELRHKGLVYFDDELQPIGELDFEMITQQPELLAQFISDMVFVNKMNTIGRNKNWELDHATDFRKGYYKQRLTNPATEANEFGEVEKWGSKFESVEEWDLYQEFYNELFETEIVTEDDGIQQIQH